MGLRTSCSSAEGYVKRRPSEVRASIHCEVWSGPVGRLGLETSRGQNGGTGTQPKTSIGTRVSSSHIQDNVLPLHPNNSRSF